MTFLGGKERQHWLETVLCRLEESPFLAYVTLCIESQAGLPSNAKVQCVKPHCGERSIKFVKIYSAQKERRF